MSTFLLFVFLVCTHLQFLYAGFIPPPTGHYHLGITQHVIKHTTLGDPFVPNNTGTSILLTLYYPTLQRPHHSRQYIDSPLAEILEESLQYPIGLLSNLTTDLQFQAPTLPSSESASRYPTLIFGPAATGPPSQCYTALLSELASRGYTVVAIDHPYEQPFLQYPDSGPSIYGQPLNYSGPFEPIYDFRLTDTVAFLNAFPQLVEKSGAPFNTTHYVLFGHSIGGAAAFGSLLQLKNATILGAINFDGSLFGAPNNSDPMIADEKKPVFLMSADHDIHPTWASFSQAQSAWWRFVRVRGTRHLDFSDEAVWRDIAHKNTPEQISGERMVALVRTYVTAFLDILLNGKSPLLDGPSNFWPEVEFFGGKN